MTPNSVSSEPVQANLYYVNNAADMVVEAANGGFNSVMTSLSYTLPANVEALYLTGSGLTGSGNSGANTLVTTGANTLIGDDGNDTFVFSAGSANGATVADFNRDQVTEWDFLVFSGFGTEAQGATFTQIGTTDQWQIHSGLDANIETYYALEPRRGACRGFRVRVRRPRRAGQTHRRGIIRESVAHDRTATRCSKIDSAPARHSMGADDTLAIATKRSSAR